MSKQQQHQQPRFASPPPVEHREPIVETRPPVEPDAIRAPRPASDDKLPVVDAAAWERQNRACPRCGSYRSRNLGGKPGPDGLMTLRGCEMCRQRYNVWEPSKP